MKNPWTAKNPFMSLWLSSANRVAGSARGVAMASGKRELDALQRDATRRMVDFWTGKTVSATKPKKRAR
jgi:hypothetical protein